MTDEFRSLFLPLRPGEQAVFAAPLTFLSTLQAASRPPKEEGEGRDDLGAQPAAALLLAMASARADGLVVVLRSQRVLFYTLRDGHRGPREVRSVAPTPAKTEAGRRPTVSCASLIPLHISFACRVRRGSAGGESTAYFRGAVGCTDGRVSVFTEESYGFSFAAHDGPVVSVEAVLTGSGGGGEHGKEARSLARATERLGFVTCGADKMVYLWQRSPDSDALRPLPLIEPKAFARYAALCLFHPPAAHWLLSPLGARGGARAEDVLPCSVALYTAAAIQHGVRSRLLGGGGATQTYPLPRELLTRVSALATDGTLCYMGAGRDFYIMRLQSDAATAAGGGGESHCYRMDTVAHTITRIVVSDAVAVVCCEPAGLLYAYYIPEAVPTLLARPPLTPLGSYRTYGGHPLVSLAVHAPAMLLVVVEATGTVELVELPRGGQRFNAEHPQHGGLTRALPSIDSLQHQCLLEDLNSIGVGGGGGGGDVSVEYAVLLESWQERAHLARCAVEVGCEQYIHRTANVS